MKAEIYKHSSTRSYQVYFDKSSPLNVTAIFCDGKVLFSAVKYLALKRRANSISQVWERQFIQAMRLLLDYSIAHKDSFSNAKEMFESFVYRLQYGSLDESGEDSSGLRWHPRTADFCGRLILKITQFSDWLYEESGGESKLLNLMRKATEAEKAINRAAYNHKQNNSFLKHTYSKNHREHAVNYSRNTSVRNIAFNNVEEKKTFPEERFADLLVHGFRVKSAKENAKIQNKYRIDYILITLLMHLGGIRLSEAFHIYVDDIIPNEGGRQIRVYHPSEGIAPAHARRKFNNEHLTRKQYLAQAFGMKDRVTDNSGLHAGWKNSTVNKQGCFFRVFFFGLTELQEQFFELFRLYLNIRVEPLPGRKHPFLFTDKNGDPLKLRTYEQAHSRAVKRIGMVPLLEYGGTRHCHRHSYGTRLANAGVDPLIIKQCMHHRSLGSQEVYTAPKITTVLKALSEGMRRLENIVTNEEINLNL